MAKQAIYMEEARRRYVEEGLSLDAIVGMLGIVVAYQGADQLRQYGASIFVVDLVGFSILREFAPLITAIIVAGRSGSARRIIAVST